MKNNDPFVTIIIPCRNEEKYIKKYLNSIIANDYLKEKLKVLVIEGISVDKTRKILKNYLDKYSFIKTLNNPKKITPVAFNLGVKNFYGDLVCLSELVLKSVENLQVEALKP